MKRILSLLLALACLASLIVIPASAQGLDQETIQKAVIETAMAYYHKGMNVQYDSQSMTYEHRVYGGSRLSTTDSPEEAADDYTLYTVCSDFCWNVYWNAFRFDSGAGGRGTFSYTYAWMEKSNPTVLLKFSEERDDYTTRDREEFIKQVQEIWQPGDIISGYGSSGGHAMMYAGDIDGDGKGDIIHSSGSKVNIDTGVDDLDNPWKDEKLGFEVGSIRYQDAYEHLFDPDTTTKASATAAGKSYSSHNICGTRFTDVALIRPSLSPDFPTEMTPATESRLKYPRLDIDRSSNLHKYLSTKTGDEITVTVTLKNYSDAAMTGIPVTEVLPVGATIVEGSANNGGVISANGVAWTVDNLPAMGEVKLSYKIKVTAARGATVQLPGGKVDQIPSRDLSYIVSGKPLANTAALTAVANGTKDYGLTAAAGSETSFANVFYDNVLGIDLGLPTKMQPILDSLFTIIDVEKAADSGYKMFSPKPVDQLDETGKYLASMFVPEHLSGKSVKGELVENSMKIKNRTMEYQEGAYEPGDIFLCMEGNSLLKVENASDVTVYIYLGDGKVAAAEDGTVEVKDFSDTIACLLRMNVSMALRPSLLRKNINIPKLPDYTKEQDLTFTYTIDTDTLEGTGNYLQYTVGDVTETIPQSDWPEAIGVQYRIPIEMEMMAKHIMDTVTFKLYDEANRLIKTEARRPVYEVLMQAMEQEENVSKVAEYEAMLHYGAAAQKYFDHNTSDLANQELSSAVGDMSAYRNDKSLVSGKKISLVYGTSCILETQPQMKIYFTDKTKTVYINGEVVELQDSPTEGYYYHLMDVAPAEIFTPVSIEVKDGDTTLATATDSIASYCARLYELGGEENQTLADALLNYGVVAKAAEA